ncbi:MAG: IgGFc-binding protein [Deltaproteobacteria bacterium]|nr:IgGFc-binding protein [Deltaproteobacteria bacterium]
MRKLASPFVLSCSMLACSAACSAGKHAGEPPPEHEAPDAEPIGASAVEVERDGGLALDGALDGATTIHLGCSGDLRSVTDDKGVVQKTCASDQGCFEGECIAACDAAAKSKGNVGCKFIAATPSFYSWIAPPCFAVFLANNWSRDVKISVSRAGTALDVTSFGRIPNGSADAAAWPRVPPTGLPPGQVAVLFMSSDPTSTNRGYALGCPVAQAASGPTAVPGTGKGQAFVVQTDAPVSAYDMLPYGGAKSFLPSAQLLLPTSAWGTNYVAVVPPESGPGPQWGQIVASEDGTTIKINPTRHLAGGGGAPAAAAGAVTTLTLNAGEYVQWQPSSDMSGSIVQADKRIAFVGGTGDLCLTSTTTTGGGCDSGHQMIAPVSALGSEYAAAPYVTRRADLAPESVLYRIVGTVDGTTLELDPPIEGAPAALSRGTVASFETTRSFVVKSQDANHPFYLGQMMSGAQVTSGSRPGATVSIGLPLDLGDEEFVSVLPPAQFLTKYVFFTDPTYSTTNLVLTRVKGPSGFADVTLKCLGVVGGWKPLGKSGRYESAEVDLVRAGKGVGACSNGPQVAESAGRFGLVVWGTDTYSSYAYPGGGNVGSINTVVVDPLPR